MVAKLCMQAVRQSVSRAPTLASQAHQLLMIPTGPAWLPTLQAVGVPAAADVQCEVGVPAGRNSRGSSGCAIVAVEGVADRNCPGSVVQKHRLAHQAAHSLTQG